MTDSAVALLRVIGLWSPKKIQTIRVSWFVQISQQPYISNTTQTLFHQNPRRTGRASCALATPMLINLTSQMPMCCFIAGTWHTRESDWIKKDDGVALWITPQVQAVSRFRSLTRAFIVIENFGEALLQGTILRCMTIGTYYAVERVWQMALGLRTTGLLCSPSYIAS